MAQRFKRYISADDLDDLFHQRQKKISLPSWQLLSTIFLIMGLVFLIINWSSVTIKLAYWWENDIKLAKQSKLNLPTPISPSKNNRPAQPTKVASPKPQALKTKVSAIDPQKIANNSIYIPKIKTQAPLIWDVTGGQDLNTDLLKALESGVVRYPKTALPNQLGNVFLTGHSSNYWWDKGQYKTVFALLDKLVAGDLIYIKYQNTLYTYKVNGQKVVSPNEISVLQATSTPILSLMTCTPTGTALRRRIVTAKLISPTDGLDPQPTQPDAKIINAVR